MQNLIATLLLLISIAANADETVFFNDGTTGWRNSNSSQISGKPPPAPDLSQNHDLNDHKPQNNLSGFGSNGTFYAPAGTNQVLDTQTGEIIQVN